MAASYLLSISETIRGLGLRAQRLRLLRNRTQKELATDAGVGLKALRRFEATGQTTTGTAVRIAIALGVSEPFTELFAAPPFQSLADVEAVAAATTRKRARRRG